MINTFEFQASQRTGIVIYPNETFILHSEKFTLLLGLYIQQYIDPYGTFMKRNSQLRFLQGNDSIILGSPHQRRYKLEIFPSKIARQFLQRATFYDAGLYTEATQKI